MQPGLLFTLEGVEGAGKTTVKVFFEEYFQQHGLPYLMTREPGGTEIAEAVRKLVLSDYQEQMGEDTELLLYFAGRAQHLKQVINPALADGKMVLSDRFTEATYAYQCGGRGVQWEKIAVLEQLVQGDLRPRQVFLLDLPVAVGLARIQQRGHLDRLEKEHVTFFERVRACYLKMVERFPQRFTVLDAMQPLATLRVQIQEKLEEIYFNYH